jgi:hypothetical protein|tara:strand:+ start:5118 stop:5654 length:537 start_codon:yes stop_codon:yes gene_type:complete
MKHILFVYPCDEKWDKEKSNLKIAEEISRISKSDEVNYVFGDNHSIFQFEANMNQPELTIYVDLIKDEMEDFMYVLVQTSKLLTSNMDPEHLEHLQKKPKRGRKPKKESPLKKLFSSEDSEFDVKKFMEEHNERVEEFYINQVCDLTLDEILDKISQNGMDSLTRTEKDKLDEYSKQI